jgi:hypothetical protein
LEKLVLDAVIHVINNIKRDSSRKKTKKTNKKTLIKKDIADHQPLSLKNKDKQLSKTIFLQR